MAVDNSKGGNVVDTDEGIFGRFSDQQVWNTPWSNAPTGGNNRMSSGDGGFSGMTSDDGTDYAKGLSSNDGWSQHTAGV
jgi:hypothetical protein